MDLPGDRESTNVVVFYVLMDLIDELAERGRLDRAAFATRLRTTANEISNRAERSRKAAGAIILTELIPALLK